MDIEIPISGFPSEFSNIRSGDIILFEKSEDMVASFLAQKIGYQFLRDGGNVIFITSRSSEEVERQLTILDSRGVNFDIYEKVKPAKFEKAFKPGSMVIIDSIDYMSSGMVEDEFRMVLERMKAECKKMKDVLIMVGNISTYDRVKRSIIRHNSDGIFQFLYNERPEGINRFIRIPRWTDGRPYDTNIFYNYQNERINIDLRSRVV